MVVHCTARVWCTVQYSNTCTTYGSLHPFHGTLCAGKRCRTYRRMIACIQTKRSAFCAQSPGRHCICGVRCAPAPPATDVVTARKAQTQHRGPRPWERQTPLPLPPRPLPASITAAPAQQAQRALNVPPGAHHLPSIPGGPGAEIRTQAAGRRDWPRAPARRGHLVDAATGVIGSWRSSLQ